MHDHSVVLVRAREKLVMEKKLFHARGIVGDVRREVGREGGREGFSFREDRRGYEGTRG